MHLPRSLAALTAVLLIPLATADGLYSKSSPVLQITGKNFDELIKKSTQASVSNSTSSLDTSWIPMANNDRR